MRSLLIGAALLCSACQVQRIVYVSESDGPELAIAADEAADRWNDEIGFDLFAVRVTAAPNVGYMNPGSIVVKTVEEVEGPLKHSGYTRTTYVNSKIAVERKLIRDYKERLPWIMAHELGHVLGLAHESDDANVMEPVFEDYDASLDFHLTREQLRRVRAINLTGQLLIP